MSCTETLQPVAMGVWAKLPRPGDGQVGYHPLLYHLIDVSSCAGALWDLLLTDATRGRLAHQMGLPIDDARAWIAFLAGAHDIGKCSPAFSQKDQTADARLQAGGFTGELTAPECPHGTLSGSILREYLVTLGLSKPLALRFAVVVAGHHGVLPTAGQLLGHDLARGGAPWDCLQRNLLVTLAALVSLPSFVPSQLPNSVAFWLAGLVSVADWIGSSSSFFRFGAPDLNTAPPFDQNYPEHARQQAHRALQELGWLAQPGSRDQPSFQSLFDFPPNALQTVTIDLGERLDAPGIVVIEAEMGQGKTEAALWLADQWRLRLGQRGIYVALPTQATSDQMFTRVANFLRKRYPLEVINLQLLHGHASLSSEFAELRRRGDTIFQMNDVYDDEAGEGLLAAAEWFTYRKRGVTAPFGVGTIDQALMAALQSKHVFVRLFGLANKTIIVDEVHAYDLYMTSVLDRLLEWLAALGSTVVLLSATLPNTQRLKLVEAYARGGGRKIAGVPTSYPRLTWAGSTGGATSIPIPAGRSRTVSMEWVNGTMPDAHTSAFPLGIRLSQILEHGGAAAVICNTVRRAQEVFCALQPYFPGLADDGWPVLDLLHARYPWEERQEREFRTLVRFGKPRATVSRAGKTAETRRPDKAVIVATQVLEQSLDIDFDVMVTDFAPTDLIFQRAGRLWRHDRGSRPVSQREPLLLVVTPPQDSTGLPQFEPGSEYVYFPHVLFRSWLTLKDRSSLSLPGDINKLVEETYAPHDPAHLPANLRARWIETETQQEAELEAEGNAARSAVIRTPEEKNAVWDIQGIPRDEDNPDVHPNFQVRTRYGDPSVSVILLEDRNGHLCFPDGSDYTLSRPPSDCEAVRLLRRAVSLSDPRLLWSLLQTDPPAAWRRSPLLRHHRLVTLRDGRAEIGSHTLHLDPDLGIRIVEGGNA